jgi:hypothetical protein
MVQSKRYSDKNEQKTQLTLTINYFLVSYKIVFVSYCLLLFPIVSYWLPLFLIDCYCFLLLTMVFHRLLSLPYNYCFISIGIFLYRLFFFLINCYCFLSIVVT